MAAQEAGQKVAKLAKDDGNDKLVAELERMRQEAKQTQERGTDVAGSFDGKKTAILDEARDVKSKAQEMMKTYLDQASDALDGFEFLTMAEAGEVGHWEILETLNRRAGQDSDLRARRLGAADPAAPPRNSPSGVARARFEGRPERGCLTQQAHRGLSALTLSDSGANSARPPRRGGLAASESASVRGTSGGGAYS